MSYLEIKGAVLAADGRVHISPDRQHAHVDGFTGTYQLRRTPSGTWLCNCPSHGDCSHAEAVAIIESGQLTWDDL